MRLLSDVSNRTDAHDELQAMEDLIDDGLLRGTVPRDGNGVVDAVTGVLIPTLKGRLFLEDQKTYLRSKTFFGRFKSNWPLFSGIIGILVGWSLGLMSPFIQQQFYPPVHTHNIQHTAATSSLTQKASSKPKLIAPIKSNSAK